MRIFTWISGMQVVAGEAFCYVKDKQHFLSFRVLLYRVNLLYCKEVLISLHLPKVRDFRPRNPRYPQRFLELYATLPCQGCAQEWRVCCSPFLFGNFMWQTAGEKTPHICWFLLNCGNSCCMFLQWLFGTVMPNWIWCCWYFQSVKSFHCFNKSFSVLHRRAI